MRRDKKKDLILDFTSLLDVVMLLLFFFILFSRFDVKNAQTAADDAKAEAAAQIALAEAEAREKTEESKKSKARYDDLIKEDTIVLLNTGWGPKRVKWDLEYEHEWPYVTGLLAEYLVRKKVRGVGIDTLSIGGWYEGTGRPCHEILLSHEIWALEEVVFPDELMKHKTCYLSAYPLKLQGFSGSMVRAVAVVEE